jgi:protein TonB
MIARTLAIVGAVMLHLAFILFGGVLFLGGAKDHGTLQQVELVEDVEADKEEEKPAEEAGPGEELEAIDEPPPAAPEAMPDLTPALEAASLSAIEAALSGTLGSGGDFAEGLTFASGGRIGGTGKPGALDEKLEQAFSLAEIDQKPQVIFQALPVYPAALRSRRIEGTVSVIFVVDPSGRAVNPRVEESTHPAFDKPALDAVRKWKFEPAVKGGERVACKMRVPIRFQPS